MENLFEKHNEKLDDIVECSYRKFKSYVYYANNLHHFRLRIAEFEKDFAKMQLSFANIKKILLKCDGSDVLLNKWIKKIDYKVLPKVVMAPNQEDTQIITNENKYDAKVEKVNFFIDAPIELLIIDTLWTLLYGKLIEEKDLLSEKIKSNKFAFDLYDNSKNDIIEAINFKSLSIFTPYFNQYKQWKNGALQTLDKMYDSKKDSILFSLDLTNYYYSVNFDFNKLNDMLKTENDYRVDELHCIMEVLLKIYQTYSKKISVFRDDINLDVILPIGLISSCLLSNIYLLDFDFEIIKNEKVKYYSRYVDDLLIIFEDDSNDYELEKLIQKYMPKIFRIENEKIYLIENEKIFIQKQKVKVLKMSASGNKSRLKLLKKEMINTSEPNLIPNLDLNLENFTESIYSNSQNESKIRDIQALSLDKYNLMQFLSDYLRFRKNTNFEDKDSASLTKQRKRKTNKTQYQKLNEEAVKQMEHLFDSNSILDIYSRWERIFYFSLLSREDYQYSFELYNNLRQKIEKLEIDEMRNIISKYKKTITARLKKDLNNVLNISYGMALAIRPEKITATKHEVLEIAKIIRHCNMFDARMVTFPLINYYECKSDIKFNVADYNYYLSKINAKSIDANLLKYSPRFIHMHEYFLLKNIVNPNDLSKGSFLADIDAEYNSIKFLFSAENDIDKINFSVKSADRPTKSKEQYGIRFIENYSTKDKSTEDLNKIHIGIANLDVEKHRNFDNQLDINFSMLSIENKLDIFKLLKESLNYSISNGIRLSSYKKKGKKIYKFTSRKKYLVNFIVFPELAVPIEWLAELCEFSRRTKTAIICGVKYFKAEKRVYNTVATILPSTSSKGYNSSVLLLREKNDYSPLEKRILENKGYSYNKSESAFYDIIKHNGINLSIFNCYELTDIFARANMKSRLDILFTPEYNPDITYFSNIIESAARDIYCFIVQVNSSNFGDTRIIAPFDEKKQNIISIKGGEHSSLHVGTINIKEFREYQEFETSKNYGAYLDKQIKNKADNDKFRKYKKTSARHKPKR